MARLKTRFVAAGLVLTLFVAMMPVGGLAQTSSELFAEAVAAEVISAPLAGPHALDLEQTSGVLTVYKAGLDISDFVAHAVFVNPEVVDGVGWDYGFQFRTTGNNEDFRVFVTSDGMWNFSVGTATPSQSAVAPGFDTTPGVANTLDLVVEGSQALFGVNGQLAGTVLLPDEPTSGDVFASTGFLGSLVTEGRILPLSDFAVYPLPGAEEATPEPATPGVEQSATLARPVQLIAGTCDEPGDLVLDLLEATYPVGEPVGSASSVVAETSFTRAPFLLGDLMAAPHAIQVSESFDAPDTLIACADIGGIPDELGGFVIGLTPQDNSGYAGTIFMAADDANGTANISVFLSPVGGAVSEDIESADEAATVDEIVAEDGAVATPEVSAGAEVTDIVAEAALDGSVIDIEAQATPAA
jgi:hypothetical protein